MSEGIPYADIVILALVAGFILLRLRSVLGSQNDEDGAPPPNRPSLGAARMQPADPIVQLDAKNIKSKVREEHDPFLAKIEDTQKVETIEAIKALDGQFTLTAFVEGASRAFEMVFDAFGKGDKPTLKMLLSDDLCKTFCKEIDMRQTGEHREDATLVSVAAEEVTLVSLDKSVARIGLKFVSEQVRVERDEGGAITGGDASLIQHVDDVWIFERDLTSKSPNWKIIET